MKILAVLLFLAFLALGAVAQTSPFRANFEIRRPNTNSAVVFANITYDKANTRYRIDYPGRVFSEIFKYQLNFFTDPRAAVSQWYYQLGEFCDSGCRASRIDTPFPQLTLAPGEWTMTAGNITNEGQTCYRYIPTNPTRSNLTEGYFTSAGRVCRVVWKDGADWLFSGFSYPSLVNTTIFDEPTLCQCADALDIIIMVDRSASVKKRDYDDARRFARAYARTFNLSPAQAHVAIAHFHVTSQVIMELYEGTSLANVDAAINAMKCSCAQNSPNSNAGISEHIQQWTSQFFCCFQRTSIAAAIDFASGMFDRSARPGSKRAVMFITDGRTNTLADGTPCNSSAVCKADLDAAIARFKTKHFNGDVFGVACSHDSDHDQVKDMCGRRPTHYCNTSDIDEEARSRIFLNGAMGCGKPVYYCDPTVCDGLCECGECRAPSACDPSSDFCSPNTLSVEARICENIPRDCAVTGNKCLGGSCNSTGATCDVIPIQCPPVSDTNCFLRSCNSATGICETMGTGNRSCGNQCDPNDANSCSDNNLCTVDSCVRTGGIYTCSYAPANCDDGDICTRDVCTDPLAGCQHHPQPAAFCDDHVSCTVDTCLSMQGCQHTEIRCNDGLACTTDYCDYELGHCVYEPIVCPTSSDNCTLNYCMAGGCNARYICEEGVVTDVYTPGVIAGISIAVVVGLAGVGGSAFVAWKICHAPKAQMRGGSAKDFAAD